MLPSLIVAAYGGSTGRASQQQCLEQLGCYEAGKVVKLAEIAAATVQCGELSLGWTPGTGRGKRHRTAGVGMTAAADSRAPM